MSKATILYVEDDLANKRLVRKLLVASGYEVIEADDGLSGIQVAEQQKPALILLDMSMPGMDGYEAAQRIKALPDISGIPVIAVTANVMPGDRDKAIKAGCDGFIAKPLDIDSFIETVQGFLDRTQTSKDY